MKIEKEVWNNVANYIDRGWRLQEIGLLLNFGKKPEFRRIVLGNANVEWC